MLRDVTSKQSLITVILLTFILILIGLLAYYFLVLKPKQEQYKTLQSSQERSISHFTQSGDHLAKD
ncbi:MULTISPECIES: hypothetical protein [Acinetobacter calcoaceticus/baumannii complex]|uniref:Uncharacterized protein n=1 Tax=Acinetobacter pittii TaxID=48296 RepID=A0A6H0FXH0_ACIPI|nr:hypothetical protein [Acinetobacter pittii]OON24691.1 hypothetical protein BI372_15230 [Acinetobacter pittii]QIT19097.1 hypothetical protein G8E09_16060 [Acinetobacter pittii]HCW3745706.1 hypothetical protein [Acinetobacter baumannii]HCW3749246.1 hypothetical protein [Acinetobacter baumannii]